MQSIIFIDSEGETIQELAAIEVDRMTLEIKDSYHAFAQSEINDSFSRYYVHGLNANFLRHNGFPCEADLIQNFKSWLDSKPHVALFGQNPHRESKVLNVKINDMTLGSWSKRRYEPWHRMVKRFKDHMVAFAGKRCSHAAHSSFRKPPDCSSFMTYVAKMEHGFHCALYDAFELYLYYLS